MATYFFLFCKVSVYGISVELPFILLVHNNYLFNGNSSLCQLYALKISFGVWSVLYIICNVFLDDYQCLVLIKLNLSIFSLMVCSQQV